MAVGRVIAMSPNSDFVQLARTPSGTLFKKEILKIGDSFLNPNDPKKRIVIDREFAEIMLRNFNDGIADIVQFPEVDDNNRHSESPSKNRGEVIDLTYDDRSIYATIDVRKNPEDVGVTLLGCSAMMSLDYENKRTGQRVGPTLLHVAGTNRPYVTGLGAYEPVIALSVADTDDEVAMLTPVEETMELDELLATLKAEHGIDVIALQQQAQTAVSAPELVTQLSAVLRAADPNLVSLSGGQDDEITVKDVAEAVVELSRGKAAADEEVISLSARLEAIENAGAEAEVDQKVREGFILPTQRDTMLEIRLSNPDQYEALLPASPIVSLSESGVTTHEHPASAGYEVLEDEIARLTTTVKSLG